MDEQYLRKIEDTRDATKDDALRTTIAFYTDTKSRNDGRESLNLDAINTVKKRNDDITDEITDKAATLLANKGYEYDKPDYNAGRLDEYYDVGDDEITLRSMAVGVIKDTIEEKKKEYGNIEISSIEKLQEYRNMVNATNLDGNMKTKINTYADSNRQRVGKKRRNHMKSAHKHAKKLFSAARDHANITSRLKAVNSTLQPKEYAKLYGKKIEKELAVLEENYKLESHTLKVGGKKDISEEYYLRISRRTYLLRKLSVLGRAKETAKKYSAYLPAEKYDLLYKQTDAEFKSTNEYEKANSFMEEKEMDVLMKAYQKRTGYKPDDHKIREKARKKYNL